MDLREKIAVMEHFANGGEVEYNSSGIWKNTNNPTWNWGNTTYRIKPVGIPWHLIDEQWKWVAADKNGKTYFFKDKPIKGDSVWNPLNMGYTTNNLFKLPNLGPWESSLHGRPAFT